MEILTFLSNTVLLGVAIWRLSSMLSDVTEAGPANLLHKFRHWVGVRYDQESRAYGLNWVADGILCVKCVSVWFGILALVYFVAPFETIVVAFPFALSGVAIMIER